MKRLQIMIEEDLDAELARVARQEGCSKAALIRGLVREHFPRRGPLREEPMTKLVGTVDFEPSHHDDIAYE
ncbi:MAG: CopG family transcriptional regulator [Solirubrobacteraceae bacterium]